jgi:hypothetical protein
MGMEELIQEIIEKRRALSTVPLKTVLLELVRDAAQAHWSLAWFDRRLSDFYPYRIFMPVRSPGKTTYFDRLITFVETNRSGDDLRDLIREAGLKPGQFIGPVDGKRQRTMLELPSSDMARRLRVVTGELPRLLLPLSKTGIASNELDLWRIMWMHAMGIKAPAIAENLNEVRRKSFRHGAWVNNQLALNGLEVTKLSKAEINETCEAMKPVKRNQIFRIHDKVYTHLADRLAPLLNTSTAAAA